MKKIVFSVVFLFSFLSFALSQTGSSAQAANRRTALRCLNQASYSASGKNWDAAVSHSELGISYDEEISDLWYILAISKVALGFCNADVLPLVEKSLNINNWVDYNRDGARILYADILCDTGKFTEVSAVLDTAPLLYSADAEFIRVKSYYRIGSSESIKKAREKIDSARRIYPDDTRFPLLFFKNESPYDKDVDVRKLADFFIKQISQYVEASPDKDAELEIYAALFAEGADKEHLLKSFTARGLKHVLYSRTALEAGLITEQKAFDLFIPFTRDGVSLVEFENLLSMISQEAVIKKIKDFLVSFDGIILMDSDDDGINNIYVKYLRGRPSEIGFDENQDGVIKWKMICDFGLPIKCELTDEKMILVWDDFPYLKNIFSLDAEGEKFCDFTLVSDVLNWTPAQIVKNEIVSEICGIDFFIPLLNANVSNLSVSDLIPVSSGVELKSESDKGVVIDFVVLNGELVLSKYYKNERLFAQCQFENNMPVVRIVDKDSDGVFETTEFYGIDKENSYQVHSLEDENRIMQNLFGFSNVDSPFYLRMIQIDRDGNTVPDFTEEYLPDQGKITSWDNDEDGLWDVRYVNYGNIYDEYGAITQHREDSMFYSKPLGNLVVVSFVDSMPVSVKNDEESFVVVKDPLVEFYWIGKPYDSAMAKACIEQLRRKNIQGECEILEYKDKRVVCVQLGNLYFGQVVPDVN